MSVIFNNLRDRSGAESGRNNCSQCTFDLSSSKVSVDGSNQVRRVDNLRCAQGTNSVVLTDEVTCGKDDKACLEGAVSRALAVCSTNPYPPYSLEADSWQTGFQTLSFPE